MSKRKRDVPNGSALHSSSEQRHATHKQQQVEHLLDQGEVRLFRALKVARGFERQKLGRRQKAAGLDDAQKEISRLEAEVIALKSLDLAKTSEIHLYKTLLRLKDIATCPFFPVKVQATVEAARQPQSPASANVQARLFNSAPVKTAIIDITANIQKFLGLGEREQSKGSRNVEAHRPKATLRDVGKRQSQVEGPDGEASDSVAYDENNESDISMGSEGDSEAAIDQDYAGRIADSEEESDEGAGRSPDEVSISSIEDDTQAILNLPKLQPKAKRKSQAGQQNAARSEPKSTTFLPALSMGGYWSGSEDGSDLGEDAPKARKNKRGQRARQKINERKYGAKANHLKKQAESRDAGWDARKGASAERPAKSYKTKTNDVPRTRSTGGSRTEQGEKREEEALHPSWIAAKKAKETKAQMAFQGKKITFD